MGCESTYTYYWLADGCREANIPFYLGHAFYMKAISGNKQKQNWVVNIEPVGNGLAALKYLAPYIFRVAISDRNILSDRDGKVTFRYRESKTNRFRLCTLDALQFIARFLQHVLPKGFVKVRYYGLFASQNRKLLEKVKELLGKISAPVKKICEKVIKSFCCPKCGSQMLFMGDLPHGRGPPLSVLVNRSGF